MGSLSVLLQVHYGFNKYQCYKVLSLSFFSDINTRTNPHSSQHARIYNWWTY